MSALILIDCSNCRRSDIDGMINLCVYEQLFNVYSFTC